MYLETPSAVATTAEDSVNTLINRSSGDCRAHGLENGRLDDLVGAILHFLPNFTESGVSYCQVVQLFLLEESAPGGGCNEGMRL